jgi:hypothetical protein
MTVWVNAALSPCLSLCKWLNRWALFNLALGFCYSNHLPLLLFQKSVPCDLCKEVLIVVDQLLKDNATEVRHGGCRLFHNFCH